LVQKLLFWAIFQIFFETTKCLFCILKTLVQFATFWFRFDIIFKNKKRSVLIPEQLGAKKNV
jgi:hypothetical protein